MASTNKTPQLGLNQWAAGDPVLREDFNGDNAKLEAVVGELATHKIVFGTYKCTGNEGDGASVNVGFFPTFVISLQNSGRFGTHGAFVMRGHDIMTDSGFIFRMTSTGFEVCNRRYGSSVINPNLADGGYPYTYIAFC